MIPFKPITGDEPALEHSPLLKAALLTLRYIQENGPIGLTPSKALKRYFVQWAAEAFNWPHYSASDLYQLNKVLNELDFAPLMVLHDLLLETKLVRHYKSAMQITKLGKQLNSQPAVLWTVLANHLLFMFDHSRYTRYGDQFFADWDVILGVIDKEAKAGITQDQLCAALLGANEKRDLGLNSLLYIHVLRPICWAGLLEEQRKGQGFEHARHFVKTSLWASALPFYPARDEAPDGVTLPKLA